MEMLRILSSEELIVVREEMFGIGANARVVDFDACQAFVAIFWLLFWSYSFGTLEMSPVCMHIPICMDTHCPCNLSIFYKPFSGRYYTKCIFSNHLIRKWY